MCVISIFIYQRKKQNCEKYFVNNFFIIYAGHKLTEVCTISGLWFRNFMIQSWTLSCPVSCASSIRWSNAMYVPVLPIPELREGSMFSIIWLSIPPKCHFNKILKCVANAFSWMGAWSLKLHYHILLFLLEITLA